MMKKKTVRLVSGIVAGILVGAMLVSVIASGIVYAGAASSAELKDKLSSLEEQKTEIKKELDSTASRSDPCGAPEGDRAHERGNRHRKGVYRPSSGPDRCKEYRA